MKIKYFALGTVLVLAVVIGLNLPTAIAETTTTITPINNEVSLKKTIIQMDIPEENTFPWGAVRGSIIWGTCFGKYDWDTWLKEISSGFTKVSSAYADVNPNETNSNAASIANLCNCKYLQS